MMNKIIQGDCLIKLKELEDNSIDSIVTDPPAGISFMGKSWDTDKGGRDNWIKWMQEVATECKRVLKPGGHAFVWTIPRTSHWTATAWENAGFEIRDVVAHVFGSGFPKSLNIGKAVDKLQGNEREELGYREDFVKRVRKNGVESKDYIMAGGWKADPTEVGKLTKGNSEWEGWGTALKPAREDWILMRKPLDKGLTIAENCLKYGTGGINIDESRVEIDLDREPAVGDAYYLKKGIEYPNQGKSDSKIMGSDTERVGLTMTQGRFPANLIHDNSEEVRECFPDTKSGKMGPQHTRHTDGSPNGIYGKFDVNHELGETYGDSGNASRFFKSIIYQAKASKSERNKGMDDLEAKPMYKADGSAQSLEIFGSTDGGREDRKNNHPTVKPIALMEYLIKMVTPKGGIVLDPFAGSGSTLVAAKQNGYQYIGIELTEEYIPIINARLND